MKYISSLIIFLFFISHSKAEIKDQIYKKILGTKNLNFSFTQTLNGKDETGECIISFPGKIYCKYDSRFNKILVSNGKSLVVKSDKNNQYFRYILKNTPLSILLNKEIILQKILDHKLKNINEKFFMISIKGNEQEINIFFEKKNFNLVGWQTEDIFQNLTITYIYDLEINKEIDSKIFSLPKL